MRDKNRPPWQESMIYHKTNAIGDTTGRGLDRTPATQKRKAGEP